MGRFSSKRDIQKFLNEYNMGYTFANVVHYITIACNTFKIKYGMYWCYEEDEEKLIQHINNIGTKGTKTNKCKICGKSIDNRSELCKSCAGVKAKGKEPKLSRDELKELLDRHFSMPAIAAMCDRSTSTIYYWKKSYGL